MRSKSIMLVLIATALVTSCHASERPRLYSEAKVQTVYTAPLAAHQTVYFESKELYCADVVLVSKTKNPVFGDVATDAIYQTTSKAVGFAIDRRVETTKGKYFINLIIASTVGHRLINLHVDPGSAC